MRPPLRLLLAALLALVMAGAGAIVSGRVVLAETSGVSMEPTHVAGDLAVIGRGGPYEIGEIVAYRTPGSDTLVLHRIVGGDSSGFTMKGDNNQSIDPHRPPAAAIVGREVLHVPHVGGLVAAPLTRGVALALALALLGAMIVNPTRTTADRPVLVRAGRRRRTAARAAWKLLLTCDVVLVVALGVVQLGAATARAADRSVAATVHQTAELGYEAPVARSTTYPDGLASTGEPVFTRLADRVDLDLRHSVDGPGRISGAARIDVELTAASGWRSTRRLLSTRSLEDDEQLHASIVLSEIRATADRVSEETGVPTGTIDVVVRPTGEAALDGAEPVPFDVELALALSPEALVPTGDVAASGAVAASTTTLSGPSEEAAAAPEPSRARTSLLLALVVAAASTILLWPQGEDDGTRVPTAWRTGPDARGG